MNKSTVFRLKLSFPNVSGLALHQWKYQFVETVAKFVYAMLEIIQVQKIVFPRVLNRRIGKKNPSYFCCLSSKKVRVRIRSFSPFVIGLQIRGTWLICKMIFCSTNMTITESECGRDQLNLGLIDFRFLVFLPSFS